MKRACLFLLLCSLPAAQAWASPETEAQIRQLEQGMAEALVATDTEALQALWAEDFAVNNPANTVLPDRASVMERVHAGIIQYAQYEQHIELLRIHGDTAIVMGEERIRPTGEAPGAGSTIVRRFTNIWMRDSQGQWRLTARHANVIDEV